MTKLKFLFLILATIIAFSGCPQPPQQTQQTKPNFAVVDKAVKFEENKTVQWETGNHQTVVLLEDEQLKEWLDKAKDKEIISIAPLTYGKTFAANGPYSAYSETSSFLIVYRQLAKSNFDEK